VRWVRGEIQPPAGEADRVSMEGLYKSNGFLDVKVDADIQDDVEGHTGDLFVKFCCERRNSNAGSDASD